MCDSDFAANNIKVFTLVVENVAVLKLEGLWPVA